jgi:hypothetical protein
MGHFTDSKSMDACPLSLTTTCQVKKSRCRIIVDRAAQWFYPFDTYLSIPKHHYQILEHENGDLTG